MSNIDGSIAIDWDEGQLKLLDQRLLPLKSEWISYSSSNAVAEAIRDMVVRGAPAIGVTAAYGLVLAARFRWKKDQTNWKTTIVDDFKTMAAARPTAVNLFWAIERMEKLIQRLPTDQDPESILLKEAFAIHEEDIAACRKMGELGAPFIEPGSSVLTHCNAGALATGGYGTALGVIRSGVAQGRIDHVYADETRPWLQGARLTAYELLQDGIDVTVIAEGAAASLMQAGKVQWVIVGSDRIAANGDVANKIGTYSAAIAARHHGVKVMVVAPISTIDMETATGADIPIEQRDLNEVLEYGGQRVAAPGANAWNPSFDVTPAELVDVIVTERGVVEKPNKEKMRKLMNANHVTLGRS
ncbi:MAG: S-methyl-5-thioribose-1-phosphate isomerase [Gammaproteobacteria bacterium]|nr:S-methyl-5-thioribose-1-phosphate isomerase [Gammaproteobacteria bacterium]MDH5693669.1 S-methyl-5-thioribose-1-phosphate isomerase [Gammaproteobacteria bacterium]